MTDTWTAQDDLILEARARAKQAADSVTWPGVQEEHVCECGTTIETHHPAGVDDSGQQVNWGFCAEVITTPGDPEVVLRGSIGDRVRPGVEHELDLMIAAINQWEEWDGSRVAYVRDGEHVLVEVRYNPDELTDLEIFMVNREFESALDNVHLEIESCMEALHYEDDDDCWCDPCTAARPYEWTTEQLQSYLQKREGRSCVAYSAEYYIQHMLGQTA